MRAQRIHAQTKRKSEPQCFPPGSYYALCEADFFVYGQVLPWPAEDHVCDEERLQYRYIREYSSHAPQGMLGTLWLGAFIAALSQEEFERARALGWPQDKKGFRQVVDEASRDN